jgi:ribosome-binding protein aMBF1 (putative translation factor)
MMTTEQFESACSVWLTQKETSTEVFAELVEASFQVFGTFQRELAHEFEVAVSTVSRWAKGTARPHPLLQKQIVRSLHRRAKGLIARRVVSSTSAGLSAPSPVAAKPG